MREIKFRAWDKGQMYYNVQNSYDTLSNGATDKVGNNIDYEWDSFGHVIKSCESLMQFTGLKDKNSVEIYEGDILQGVAGSYEVKWNNNTLNWVAYDGGNLGLWAFNEPEVIGNIYENPELLESKGDK